MLTSLMHRLCAPPPGRPHRVLLDPWRSALVLLLILAVIPAWSQQDAHAVRPHKSLSQLVPSYWTSDDGLPQNSINDLYQSTDGYVWIATQEGIARFDGIVFTVFNRRSHRNLPSNHVNELHEGTTGEMFLGTNAGLAMLNGNSIRPGPTDLLGVPVVDLDQDERGTLWIATPSGLYGLTEDSLHAHILSLKTSMDVRCVEARKDGTLWLGTKEHGLVIWADSIIAQFGPADGLPDAPVNAMFTSSDGTLFFGYAAGGLFRSDGKRIVKVTSPVIDEKLFLHDFSQSREGTIWVGTSDGLLRMSMGRSGTTVARYGTDDGLPGSSVHSVLVDREGSLWTGTFGKGLGQFIDGPFIAHGFGRAGEQGIVFCVLQDSRERIWVGTETDGVFIFDRNQPGETIGTIRGLPDQSVFSMTEDSKGTMWLGTMRGGLVEYRNGIRRVFNSRNGLPDDFVRAIREDAEGAVWVGTRNGLSRIQNGRVRTFSEKDGLTSAFIRTLFLDRSNVMWVGTLGGGVFRFDGARFTNYSITNGLPSNDVWAIYEEVDGTKWFGTNGSGLARLRNDSLTIVSTEHGLADDVVLVILEDSSGHFWMSSNHGVTHVSKQDLHAVADGRTRTLKSVMYGRGEGMKSTECSAGQPAGIIDSRGRIWIPTTEEVATVNPARLETGPPKLSVNIEAVVANGIPQPTDSVVVQSSASDRIEFIYTALSFLSPRKIQFRYMLSGHDQQWIDGRTQRIASYTNIPPGSYRFLASARHPDGTWSDVVSIPVTVEAGLVDTVWFRSLAVLLVLGSIGMVYSMRIRASRRRERALANTVEERTHALREQKEVADRASAFKSHLLEIASHDLKSPLISIRGFAQLLKEGQGLPDDVRESADAIHRLSQSTLLLINELLDASAVERGQIVLQKRPTNVSDLAETLAQIHRIAAGRKAQKIHFSGSDPGACVVDGDPGRLQAIFENLLSNAMKFSPAGSNVWVRVESEPNSVTVSVRDEGPGISAEDREHLFGMFRTLSARPTGGEPTTGVGLALTKRFVELHGGSISLESRPGEGSTFSVTIPKRG